MNKESKHKLLKEAFTARHYQSKLIKSISDIVTDNDTIPDIVDPEPDTSKLYGRVALLTGHNEKQPGAWIKSPSLKESEFTFYNKVFDIVINRGLDNVEFKRFNRTYGGGYTEEIDRVYKEIDEFNPTFVIDGHFNGGGGAYSMIMYYQQSKVSRRVADAMSVTFADAFSLRNYNIEEGKESVPGLISGENGYYSMVKAKCPSVLLEPFFGDHWKSAAKVADMGHKGYASLLIESIKLGLSVILSD